MKIATSPTGRSYSDLDRAYQHFNEYLFSGKLPNCLITLQRHANAYGYFSGNRFGLKDSKEITDEIALNPQTFESRTPIEILIDPRPRNVSPMATPPREARQEWATRRTSWLPQQRMGRGHG